MPRSRLHYPDVPYHFWMQQAAGRQGNAVALAFEDDRYTFAELDGFTNAVARGLRALGIEEGERIVVMVANRPESIIATHAVSAAGCSFVLINSTWQPAEVRHAMELTAPVAVIADAPSAAVMDDAGPPDIKVCVDDDPPSSGWHTFDALIDHHPGTRLAEQETAWHDREAALLFSSGTTGLPKSVVHTHGSLTAATVHWSFALGLVASDVVQLTVPLGHILGSLTMTAALHGQARVRLFRRFDVDAMLESIHQDRVSVAFAVAPIALALAQHPRLEQYDLSSLRYLDWSATPVSKDVAARVTERTGTQWVTAYGATESPVLTCNPVHMPDRWRLDTPGLPVPDMELRVADLDTGAFLPSGEVGEIVVRGPNVMQRYIPEEANDDAFLDGEWFRTGDIGWVEPEGWVHLTDRAKEMIKVSGYQVAPAEIEATLLTNPDVADCAVVGVPHETRGEVPLAAVVAAEGATLDETALMALVREHHAPYKQLSGVRVVDSIPRTASGKVLRRVLKEDFQSAEGR